VNWLQFGVQWLHVLLGIVWFGYALSMYFLIAPPLAKLPEGQQREAFGRLAEVGPKVFPIVATLVLVLGFVRGTFLGRIKDISDLATPYGIFWLVGLIGTLALLFTGARFIGPGFDALRDAPDYEAAAARLRAVSRIDLGIFFVVFSCMILMRFN
jgi:putative copper export protein